MILVSKMITPDGTELYSRHRHDFVSYIDKNGKRYILDGGVDYTRSSLNGDEKFIKITTEDDFEVIRNEFSRYNRYSGTYVKLKDIDNSWLENIITWFIDNNYQYSLIFAIFIEEKLYRIENEIYITPELEIDFK